MLEEKYLIDSNSFMVPYRQQQTGFKICEHITPEIVGKYQEVLQYVQNCGLYKEQALRAWPPGDITDPWLIAAAAVNDYTKQTFGSIFCCGRCGCLSDNRHG